MERTWMIKHNMSRTRVYKIWQGMRSRCNNPKHRLYKYYGARGIKVCDEWDSLDNGFTTFYTWAIANGYSENLSIDRIDFNKGYEPDNCRWADSYTQNVHLNKKPGSSGYIGVTKHTNHDSWYGRIKVYGKCICTGSAPSPLEAAIMRDKYIVEHGLLNRLNGVLNG